MESQKHMLHTKFYSLLEIELVQSVHRAEHAIKTAAARNIWLTADKAGLVWGQGVIPCESHTVSPDTQLSYC